MAREPGPIAIWLRSTRLRQRMSDGAGGDKPWTVEHLLALMQAEIGWAPHRPNYSRYETGKATPRGPTFRRFVDFWGRRGEPGPDLTPRVIEPEPSLAGALSDLAAELRTSREERGRLEERLQELEAVVARLAAQALEGQPTQPTHLLTTES